MRGVVIERAVLVGGAHHDAGTELLVGETIDVDTASRLVREGCAKALEAAPKKGKGKGAPAPSEDEAKDQSGTGSEDGVGSESESPTD